MFWIIMPFDNHTVMSYGKKSFRSRKKPDKTKYYVERNVISYKPATAFPLSKPDPQSRIVPLLPSLPPKTSSNRYESRRHVQSSHHITQTNEYEKQYYVESEKSRFFESQLKQTQDINSKLEHEKKLLTSHYEDFINKLKEDLKRASEYENRYNKEHDKCMRLENELSSLKIEIDMLNKSNKMSNEVIINELRTTIRKLQHEKNELMDELKVKELRFSRKLIEIEKVQNEIKNNDGLELQRLKQSLDIKEKRISELLMSLSQKQGLDALLEQKNKEISSLNTELSLLRTRTTTVNTATHTLINNNQERVSMTREPRVSVIREPRVSVIREPRVSVIREPRVSVINQPRTSIISQPRTSFIRHTSPVINTQYTRGDTIRRERRSIVTSPVIRREQRDNVYSYQYQATPCTCPCNDKVYKINDIDNTKKVTYLDHRSVTYRRPVSQSVSRHSYNNLARSSRVIQGKTFERDQPRVSRVSVTRTRRDSDNHSVPVYIKNEAPEMVSHTPVKIRNNVNRLGDLDLPRISLNDDLLTQSQNSVISYRENVFMNSNVNENKEKKDEFQEYQFF